MPMSRQSASKLPPSSGRRRPQLPEGVSYPTIHMKVPDENASRPFMSFTLNAPSTPILIQQYAEEHIKPRLANIPGIYKVELSGATPMEWRLEYDSEQLRLLGVTLSDIRRGSTAALPEGIFGYAQCGYR